MQHRGLFRSLLLTVAAVTLATLLPLSMAAGSAYVGGFVGFHLVGVPTGLHCGLAVLPAVIAGGCLGLIAAMVGLVTGAGLATGLIEQFVLNNHDDEEF
jgi:hypothetical protein